MKRSYCCGQQPLHAFSPASVLFADNTRWILVQLVLAALIGVTQCLRGWPADDDNTAVNLSATQYKQIKIPCDLSNENKTSVYWRKNGQLVETTFWDFADETTRFQLTNKRHHPFSNRFYLDHRGNLIVDTVRLEDSGQWRCQVFDENQRLINSKSTNLIVYDLPKNPYFLIDNRILDPNSNFISVRENSEITISCVVDNGSPKPKLEWALRINTKSSLNRNAYDTNSDLNITDIVDQNQKNGARSDVHFRKILRAHHNATISCLVHHLELSSPINISLVINVQYVPSFIISRVPGFGIPIVKGMTVSLKCEVDSNPPSEPVWQMNDQDPPVKQISNGFLNFTSIKISHKGWYKCLSKHVYGRFASTSYFLNVRDNLNLLKQEQQHEEEAIEFKKRMEHEADFEDMESLSISKKRQIEVTLGGAVQLQCPPGTAGCWSKFNPSTNNLDPLGSAQELKLEKIIYQEAGEYRCVVPNKDFKHQMDSFRNLYSVELSVIGQPVIFNRNQSFSIVSSRTHWNMSFDFCANPPHEKTFWIVGDRIVKPGQTFGNHIVANYLQKTISQYCYRAILTFLYVTVRHSGQYGFFVGSSRGLADGYIFLNVTQNQTDPEFMGFSNKASSLHMYYHKINHKQVFFICLVFTVIRAMFTDNFNRIW